MGVWDTSRLLITSKLAFSVLTNQKSRQERNHFSKFRARQGHFFTKSNSNTFIMISTSSYLPASFKGEQNV